jgi:hypothetical protein
MYYNGIPDTIQISGHCFAEHWVVEMWITLSTLHSATHPHRLLRNSKESMRNFKESVRNFKESVRNFKESMRNSKESMRNFKESMRNSKESVRSPLSQLIVLQIP